MVTAENRRWLLRRPSPDAPARLFCFPYSGTGAAMYNRWPERVGPVEICPVQLPGRENRIRERHYGTYEQLAERVVDGLGPYLDRPFGFFGHCGAALPAVAAILELERTGGPPPSALFVSSQVAPHDGPFGRFLQLGPEELRAELARLVVEMGGIVQADALDLGLEILQADIAANQRYRVAPPVRLHTDVYAIGWSGDHEIRPDQMTGWSEWAEDGRFTATVLDGGHHAFLGAPAALTELVRRGLAPYAGEGRRHTADRVAP